MITLGFDTSTACASVALAENGRRLSSCISEETASHSEALGSMVEHCLTAANKSLSEITAIGVVTGPGSFTGLRIGISFVMGLCRPYSTPVVAVSSLEAMAGVSGVQSGTVRALIDARRNEVFTALFALSPQGAIRMEEDRIALFSELSGCEPATTVGRGPVPGCRIDMDLSRAETGIIAALLARQPDRARFDARNLRPSYFRLSAAEEKQKNQKPA